MKKSLINLSLNMAKKHIINPGKNLIGQRILHFINVDINAKFRKILAFLNIFQTLR